MSYIEGGDAISTARVLDGFREGLRELGLTEGENILVDYYYADAQEDRLPGIVAPVVMQPVDLIVTTTT